MTGALVFALVAVVGAVVGAALAIASTRRLDARAARYLDQRAAERVLLAWATKRKPTSGEER